jgi:hypothetical protein
MELPLQLKMMADSKKMLQMGDTKPGKAPDYTLSTKWIKAVYARN